MKKILLHTPEGVRDIYNNECARKLYLQQHIHDVLKEFGYSDIQTPSFEFFDIFSKEKGTVPSKEMYKFFDREGETLVLRPDMTPSIARCVSKYYMDETMPIRLCYSGQTFINTAEHQGKLKEVTHIGAELIGDDRADADAEVIAMVIKALLNCGLRDFQIEVGHAYFFEGLLQEANISEEDEEELRILVENKNFFGMEEYLSELDIDENIKKVFLKLPELIGSGEMIAEAKTYVSADMTNIALNRLERVYTLLSYYGYEQYVSFDLSSVATKNYYTGVIFKAYTYGTGDAIATGGRYDNLLRQFGKEAASIGFAINLDRLLIAMSRHKVNISLNNSSVLIVYENHFQKSAIDVAARYRKDGNAVTLIRRNPDNTMEDYKNFAEKNEFTQMYYLSNDDGNTEKIK